LYFIKSSKSHPHMVFTARVLQITFLITLVFSHSLFADEEPKKKYPRLPVEQLFFNKKAQVEAVADKLEYVRGEKTRVIRKVICRTLAVKTI